MSIDWAYFTRQLDRIVNGVGYVETVPVEYHHFRLTSGGPLTTSGNQKVGADPGTYGVCAILTSGAAGTMSLNFTIPGDYDDSSDELKLALNTVNEGAGTIVLTSSLYYRKTTSTGSAAAEGTDLLTQTTDFTNVATAETVLDFSDLGLSPGDTLTLVIARDAGLAQDMNIFGGEWRYRSNLAMTDKTKR